MGRRPAQLSGGQRQRVAMGRALVREPQVFLLDEPLSNLDAKLRTTMRAELARLHERLGITTVYVTHDQVEAMTLGQRVAVLRDGVLQQFGDPQELFHRPVNLFVAAFIGSPTMNLVSARVRRRAGGVRGPRAAAAGGPRGHARRRRARAAAGRRSSSPGRGPTRSCRGWRSRPRSSRRWATRRWSRSASTRRRSRSRRCATDEGRLLADDAGHALRRARARARRRPHRRAARARGRPPRAAPVRPGERPRAARVG